MGPLGRPKDFVPELIHGNRRFANKARNRWEVVLSSGTCRSLDRGLGRSRWDHHWNVVQLTVGNIAVAKLMTSGYMIWNKECRVVTHGWLRDVDRHHDQVAVANICGQRRVAMSYSWIAIARKLRVMGSGNAAPGLQWRGRERLVAGAPKTCALKLHGRWFRGFGENDKIRLVSDSMLD